MPAGFCGVLLLSILGAGGELRIAGYTTVDQQVFGPALKRIEYDPMHGVHLVWKDANSYGAYNFLDGATGEWRWSGGIPVFPRRVALGNIALNPRDSIPTISGSFLEGGRHRAVYVYDAGIGQGRFTAVINPTHHELQWNLNTFASDGRHQFAALRHDTVVHHRGGAPANLGRSGDFPSHNIAGSRVNLRVAIFWTRNQSPNMGDLYLRRSTNAGYGWRDTVVPSRSIPSALRHTFLGAYGEYDPNGELHIVVNTYDGRNRASAELWHYCEANQPNWSLVHSFAAPQLNPGSLPDEALICGRPSIGFDPVTQDAFVVWEQADPDNIEPGTGIARFDIWAARSEDNGQTWAVPVRLTEPDNTSKVFPNLAGYVDDNLHICLLIDSVAGIAAFGQGRATDNPVAYLRFPVSMVPTGVAEQPLSRNRQLTVSPNPGRDRVMVCFGGQEAAPVFLQVRDIGGRLIRQLPVQGETVIWDGCDPAGRRVPAGVYWLSTAHSAPVRVLLVR